MVASSMRFLKWNGASMCPAHFRTVSFCFIVLLLSVDWAVVGQQRERYTQVQKTFR